MEKIKTNNFSVYWMLSDIYEMTKRSILHMVRNLDQLLSVSIFPIMFMLLFRYVFGGAIDTGDTSYVNFLVAGILVQTLAFGANYTTINLAVDLKEGIIDRFKTLPMSSSALLIGHIFSDLVRNALSAVIMLGVGFLVGFRPDASFYEWILIIILATLFSLAISWLSAIMGLLVKSIEAAQWVGFIIIFPLTIASSAFVPTSTMPPLLRTFAENQPVTQVINAMRSWLVGTTMGNSDRLAFIWCILIIVICLPIATYMFNRRGKV